MAEFLSYLPNLPGQMRNAMRTSWDNQRMAQIHTGHFMNTSLN